jgi:tRNA (cmo5U34)-methyltransferase
MTNTPHHLTVPRSWTFETNDVAKGFDQHVREQLPWYELATNAISHVARHYIPQDGLVYDIGCSTGNIGCSIQETLATRNAHLIGIEPSQAMQPLYRAPGEFACTKAQLYPYKSYDLAILFLCLMFVEPSERRSFINDLYDKCKPGGAIIIFDKLEPVDGYISTIMYRLTLAGKFSAGVSSDEIIQKELSLAGVQRPISPDHLPGNPYQWFRFGDFAGFIIEKPI